MGLKRLSPRAMPALIIAANMPDIDSFVANALGLAPRTFHRGFTHGIGGLVVMPFVDGGNHSGCGKSCARARGTAEARRPASRLLHRHAQPSVTRLPEHLWRAAPRAIFAPLVLRRRLVHHRSWIWITLIVGLELSVAAPSGRAGTGSGRRSPLSRRARLYRPERVHFRARRCSDAAAGRTHRAASHDRRRRGAADFLERQVMWRGDKLSGSADYDPLQRRASSIPKIVPLG